MTHSILEVARSIEELGASTEETSASIRQMDVTIGQVETNANETARLSEQVVGRRGHRRAGAAEDAGRHRPASATSSQHASRVIEGLGRPGR